MAVAAAARKLFTSAYLEWSDISSKTGRAKEPLTFFPPHYLETLNCSDSDEQTSSTDTLPALEAIPPLSPSLQSLEIDVFFHLHS